MSLCKQNVVFKKFLNDRDNQNVAYKKTTRLLKPYKKNNNVARYVNAKLNHSPSILGEIPKYISKRILSNSCNEQVFNAAAPFHNNILDKCGYSGKLTFEKEQ